MAKINHKHKTVGVSFNPLLRQGANRRARLLGLTFSRYVSLCIEAEIAGQVPLGAPRGVTPEELEPDAAAGLPTLAENAGERLRTDVADLLRKAGVAFICNASAGALAVDFLVEAAENPPPGEYIAVAEKSPTDEHIAIAENSPAGKCVAVTKSAPEAKCIAVTQSVPEGENRRIAVAGVDAARARVVIECRYPSAGSHVALLGKAVMLQQLCGVQAVLLCVPYLSVFEPEIHAVFTRQRIDVVTPDSLPQALQRALAATGEMTLPRL